MGAQVIHPTQLNHSTIRGYSDGASLDGPVRDLKLVLDPCAINYASLFPDPQGSLDMWRYKWGLPQGNLS